MEKFIVSVYMRKDNMNDYKEGTKRIAVCTHCERSVQTTLSRKTLSLCKGLKEVENVLIRICDECGNITSYPAKSMSPIQQIMRELIESKIVSGYSEMSIELKIIEDKKKEFNSESEPDKLELAKFGVCEPPDWIKCPQ